MTKRINKKKLYRKWAKEYDVWPNVRDLLENQKLPEMLGDIKRKYILDLGCGTGRWSIKLAKKGAIVTAVDESKEMLQVLENKIKAEKLNITPIHKNISKLKPKNKFDIIIMNFVDDHIKNLGKIFKIAKNHLKENGIFIISSPIYFPEIKKPMKKEISIMKNKYKISFYVHPEQEMKNLAKKFNLKVVAIEKIFVDDSVKHLFDKKPHKPFSENKGKHFVTIYKFKKK